MAGSGTYQVSTSGYQDIAQPFLSGTRTLSDAIQGKVDNRVVQDELRFKRTKQNDLLREQAMARQEREKARAAAAAERAKSRSLAASLRAETKAQNQRIMDTLLNVNKPGGVNTGKEVQDFYNAPYNKVTDDYSILRGALDNETVAMTAQRASLDKEKATSDSLMNTLNMKAMDTIRQPNLTTYDTEGRAIKSKGESDTNQFQQDLNKESMYREDMYNNKLIM